MTERLNNAETEMLLNLMEKANGRTTRTIIPDDSIDFSFIDNDNDFNFDDDLIDIAPDKPKKKMKRTKPINRTNRTNRTKRHPVRMVLSEMIPD